MSWFKTPQEFSEKTLRENTDYRPFSWILVNDIWVNMDNWRKAGKFYILEEK